MNFDSAMKAAAKRADRAVALVIEDYRAGNLTDEDDISPALVGSLKAHFAGQVGGLTWSASVMRHRRGDAAQEAKTGADLLMHVSLDTNIQKYSKGVLVQAKKVELESSMTKNAHQNLVTQCNTMLSITSSAFVFNYTSQAMRCGSATKVAGSSLLELNEVCDWTSYRFFLELFRCPIGDPRITSALFKDLRIPNYIALTGSGDLDR